MAKAMIFDGLNLKETTYNSKDSYEFIKNNVGGYIERVPLRDLAERNIDLWINEEGKLIGLDTTALLTSGDKVYDELVGNLVFTKSNGDGDTISLTDDDIKYIKKKFDTDGYYVDLKFGRVIQVLAY